MPGYVTLPLGNPLTAQLDPGGAWHITIFLGCAAAAIRLLWEKELFGFRLNIFEKLLMGYAIIRCLYLIEYPSFPFGIYNTAYQAAAGQTLAEILFIPLGAYLFRRWAFKVLPFVVVYELFCIWTGGLGLLFASSFNSVFCAMAAPFLPAWLIVMTTITVLSHHGSTALLVLGAQSFAWALRKGWMKAYLTAVPILILAAAYFHSHGAMFDGEERLRKYREFMSFWAQNPWWIVSGVGPGSFLWKSLEINRFDTNAFLQLHSDWLQIPWEYGLAGLSLVAGMVAKSAKAAWGNTQTLAALFGCIASMTTMHPLRFFPTSFLVALILISCKENQVQARRTTR